MNTYTLQTPIGEIHTLVIEEMKAKHLKLIQNTSIYFTNNEIHIMKNAYSAEPIQTQKGEISGLTFRTYKSKKL